MKQLASISRLFIAAVIPITVMPVLAGTTIVYDRVAADHPLRILSEEETAITMEFTLSAIRYSRNHEDSSWVQIEAPGLGLSSECGLPELPQLSTWIEQSSSPLSIVLVDSEVVRERWGVVQPAPDPLYRSGGGRLVRRVEESVYNTGGIYPAVPVSISFEGVAGRLPVALLTLNPVQYDFSSHECVLWKRLTVRVEGASRFLLNGCGSESSPSRLLMTRQRMVQQDRGHATQWIPPRLLIVTDSIFVSALTPFVQWKYRCGVPAALLRFTEIATDAASLRRYLVQYSDTAATPPEFLLIVGDVEYVPAFYGVGGSLTDHPYSTLVGSDYLPDISVGRIPCRTDEECREWVTRTLSYERDAMLPVAINGLVFSSSVALDPAHGIYVSNLFRSTGLAVDHLQQPQSGSLAQLLNSLNAGRQWIFYIGHGYPQAWSSVSPSFTNTQVSGLVAATCPLVFSVACATADFDFPNRCLGEFWHDQLGCLGPVSYFGATENTAFFRSDTLVIEALRAIFLQGVDRLGLAADYGRLMTARCFPQRAGGLTEETIQQFVLLGDPSLRVFSTVPESLSVTGPRRIPTGAVRFSIRVTRAGLPMPMAEVCIADAGNEFYGMQPTDSQGRTEVAVEFSEATTLHVTVTASNSFPYQGRIEVARDVTPNIELSQIRVQDQSGDNDGLLDRGETSLLLIGLHNAGTADLTNSFAKVISVHELLRCDSSWFPLPSLPPRGNAWIDSGFRVIVGEVTDGDVASATLLIRTDMDTVSEIPLNLTLHAPAVRVGRWRVRELAGDRDGLLEAEEVAELIAWLSNAGSDEARNMAVAAWSAVNTVQFLDSTATVTLLAPGDSVMIAFRISSDSGWRRGELFEFGIHLHGENVTPHDEAVAVRVNQIPVLLLVLDNYPQQVEGIEAALQTLGIEYQRSNVLPLDLTAFSSVWIFSGMFPNAVALSAPDARRIAGYLDEGGNCYWEGGDVWAYDPQTSLHPYFGIVGVSDGTSNAGPITGNQSGNFRNLQFEYGGENNFVDQLRASSGGIEVLRNQRPGANYPVAILNAGNSYRTYGTSIETGALRDSLFPDTRVNLIRLILEWFGIHGSGDIEPPSIVHHPIDGGFRVGWPVRLFADIQDASGVQDAWISFGIGSLNQQLPLQFERGWYHAQLPSFASGSVVRYRFTARDGADPANVSQTPIYLFHVNGSVENPMDIRFRDFSFEWVSDMIRIEGEASWCITEYPEGTPVLELSAARGGRISLVTPSVDLGSSSSPYVTFWMSFSAQLPEPESSLLLRASTDGGQTFSLPLWEHRSSNWSSPQCGDISVPLSSHLAGKAEAVLQFELTGSAVCRLNEIRLSSHSPISELPVSALVISSNNGAVVLRWPPVGTACAYRIEATLEMSSPFEEMKIIADTTYTDTDLRSSTKFYRVIALCQAKATVASDSRVLHPLRSSPPMIPDLLWNRKRTRS